MSPENENETPWAGEAEEYRWSVAEAARKYEELRRAFPSGPEVEDWGTTAENE